MNSFPGNPPQQRTGSLTNCKQPLMAMDLNGVELPALDGSIGIGNRPAAPLDGSIGIGNRTGTRDAAAGTFRFGGGRADRT
jgi:hypothetical protein